MLEDKAGVKKQVEWCAVTEMDLKQNSPVCPLFSVAALSTPPSSKSSFSFPSQAQRRVIRIAKKRKRSTGDLSKRRHEGGCVRQFYETIVIHFQTFQVIFKKIFIYGACQLNHHGLSQPDGWSGGQVWAVQLHLSVRTGWGCCQH